MDYQGNYFPEEHDENESKTYRIVKGIFKWTMYGISFVLYAIIIYMMIVNRDSKILDRNYMADNQTMDEVSLYQINTRIFMNDDGSLQLHDVDYYEELGYLEIGVKYNAKKLAGGNYSDSFDYVLTDSNGKTYKLVNLVNDKGGRYGFERICFEEVVIDLDSNDLRFNLKNDDEAKDFNRTNVKYELSVYNKDSNKLIFTFNLYDNSTTFNKTDYND